MKRALKIAFLGSSLVSAYWNGAATYYRGIIRALHDLGHQTTFFEPDTLGRQEHRDLADPQWAQVVVYPASESGVQSVLEQAMAADVIVKASGVGAYDSELEFGVIELKRPENLVVFWDVDAPATLDRMLDNSDDPFVRLVPEFDLILTYGGGNPVVKAYKNFDAKACVPIYNALDPSSHFPVSPQNKFRADLAFLGNRLPDREQRVDEFFIRAARVAPDCHFLMAGSGWTDKDLPQNINYVGHLFTAEHNAFNCSAKAVLNICRESMARYGFSPPTRIFEAAGAGGCIVSDHWAGLEEFLEPGLEVLVARNGAEVVEITQALDGGRAKKIGEAARKRTLSEHTYYRRAAQVQEVLWRAVDSR